MSELQKRIQSRRKAVTDCVSLFGIPDNPAIDESVLAFRTFPATPSKKLALLVLAYKREATAEDVTRISTQPAGLVKSLRNDGFDFQTSGASATRYYYRNANGSICRFISGYRPPPVHVSPSTARILSKSILACVSAIEIYNKPDFKYREECFAILLINAWELLLKAKAVADGGRLQAIYEYDRGRLKRNRCGNPMTASINSVANVLLAAKALDSDCWTNIELILEVRDNAIHFVNKGRDLSRTVLELGTASLRNYVTCVSDWFGRDLSEFNFFLMPMSFFHEADIASRSVVSSDKQTLNLIEYLGRTASSTSPEGDNPFAITLRLETRFVRTYDAGSVINVKFSNDEAAPKVGIAEDDIYAKKYPLDYAALVKKCTKRYSDFVQNARFHNAMRMMKENDVEEHLSKVRYLDARRKQGTSKRYYSEEVLKRLDKLYSKL